MTSEWARKKERKRASGGERRDKGREKGVGGVNAHKVVVESAKAGKFVGAIVGRSDT